MNTIVAHTLLAESASTYVLRRNGFTFQQAVHDPQDGLIWSWLHEVAA